jgi:hypothetical protein
MTGVGAERAAGRGDDPAVAELRARLRDAEDAITVPPGLWVRVSTPRAEPVRRPRSAWIPVAAAAAVIAVAAASFTAGALWQQQRGAALARPTAVHATAAPGTITSTVQATSENTAIPGAVCGTGSSNVVNITTCVVAVGSSTYLTQVRVWASVKTSARTLQACLTGPDGTIACTPYQSVAPDSTLILTWSPASREPAGQYCATTTSLGTDESRTRVGSYCVDVGP